MNDGVSGLDLRVRLNNAGIMSHEVDALCRFATEIDFTGARILEIGGHSLPPAVRFGVLQAKSWLCVDFDDHVSGSYQIYKPANNEDEIGKLGVDRVSIVDLDKKSGWLTGNAIDLPIILDEHFDIVMSICAFEHVRQLPRLLDRIWKLLAEGGTLLSYFGPIWSGHCGHHVWIDEQLNFNTSGPIGDWDHLLLSQSAMLEKLMQAGLDLDVASRTVDMIYADPVINRLFFEDYERMLAASRFSERVVVEIPGAVQPDCATATQLRARYPDAQHVCAYGAFIKAVKR